MDPWPQLVTKRSRPNIVAAMEESDFEGTLVLEQLVTIGKVEEFFDAIDVDDVERATLWHGRTYLDAGTGKLASGVERSLHTDGRQSRAIMEPGRSAHRPPPFDRRALRRRGRC